MRYYLSPCSSQPILFILLCEFNLSSARRNRRILIQPRRTVQHFVRVYPDYLDLHPLPCPPLLYYSCPSRSGYPIPTAVLCSLFEIIGRLERLWNSYDVQDIDPFIIQCILCWSRMRNDSSTPSQDLDRHYRATHSALRPFKCPRTIEVSTSRGKCRKYVCRCQMGHLRRPTREGGREQMKDELNETLSARMCIWGEG